VLGIMVGLERCSPAAAALCDEAFEGVAEVLQQVPAVDDDGGVWGREADGFGVAGIAVASHHPDFGVGFEVGREALDAAFA